MNEKNCSAVYGCMTLLLSRSSNISTVIRTMKPLCAAFDKASSEYEDAFGPLTAREVDVRGGHWNWIDDPWPWEGADN